MTQITGLNEIHKFVANPKNIIKACTKLMFIPLLHHIPGSLPVLHEENKNKSKTNE